MEQLKKADATLEKARQEGKAAVEEVQTLLSEEKKSWDTERSTLSTRLEEVSILITTSSQRCLLQ